MTQYINLPVYGIKIALVGDGLNGSIESDFELETCPFCSHLLCVFECDQSQSEGTEEEVRARLLYNGSLAAVEQMVLAQACAGIDIETPAYLEALETVVDAVANKYT